MIIMDRVQMMQEIIVEVISRIKEECCGVFLALDFQEYYERLLRI